MIVGLTFVIPLFIAGYKNTVKSSIISGKRKIDSPSIRGKWTKPIDIRTLQRKALRVQQAEPLQEPNINANALITR